MVAFFVVLIGGLLAAALILGMLVFIEYLSWRAGKPLGLVRRRRR